MLQTIVNEKIIKKVLFLDTYEEIFLDKIDTVFFRHGSVLQAKDRLTRIHTDSSIVSNRGYTPVRPIRLPLRLPLRLRSGLRLTQGYG